jgi:prepilin peptidase CpaA
LIASVLVSALVLNSWSGFASLKLGLQGMAMGLGLGLIPFALHMLGGGDVKFLAAIGSLSGPALAWSSFFLAAAAEGAVAALLLLAPRFHLAAERRVTLPFTSFLAASLMVNTLLRIPL